MKKYLLSLFSLFVLAACSEVPVLERNQVNIIPHSQIRQMADQNYAAALQQQQVVEGTEAAMMLDQVGTRMARAVEQFLVQNDLGERTEEYNWEFTLLQDDMVNAWAMPGGKVAFYTGIIQVAENEAGIAAVMGHEIAHVVARHGNERMSQMLLAEVGALAVDVALSQKPEQTRAIFQTAYGAVANVGVVLPFSRLHETEADRLGIIFMAMAGYDPQEAIDFWKRMAAQASGPAQPEFLSTHPHPETRVENLRQYLPLAQRYYQKALKQGI